MVSFVRRLLCVILIICLSLFFLPVNAENTEVKMLQERMLALGYEIGKADGIPGEKTSSVILLAQTLLSDKGYDVSVTGSPDAKTVDLIMQEENSKLLQTLLRGSWGSRVKEAQRKLIELDLLQDSVDGKFGANTEKAVIAFEEWLAERVPDQVNIDGRLSVAEYSLLMSDLSVYGYEAPVYFDDTHPGELRDVYLYARNACLINAVTGEVLLEKAADEPAEPASTTKIITLLTALSLCNLDETIVIPDAAVDVPKDSTLVPVSPGETMTMRDLLYAMMIRSGNDAANAVAVLCSGSTEAFAEKMNQTARNLEMENSHFVNAHGYTAEGHYTTARDLVTAARYGLTQEPFREIVTCLKYTLPATEKREELVLNSKWEIWCNQQQTFF